MGDTELWKHLYRASQRKRRLFECACCRLVWDELKDERSRAAVTAAELYADGRITKAQLAVAEEQAWRAWDEGSGGALSNGSWDGLSHPYASASYNVAIDEMGIWGGAPISQPPSRIIYDLVPDQAVLTAKQQILIRDLIGEPSEPAFLDPSWCTDIVVSLARQMYELRDFSAMPILTDALQDAGCDHEPILSHCRGPGPHVRGCWVIDLVLGTDERPEHEDPVLGRLKWDEQLNGWLGEVDLRPGFRVEIVVSGADEDRVTGYRAARDSFAWLRTHEADARHQVAADRVRWHNRRRPGGIEPVTAEEFAARIELFRAELAEDGVVRLSYRDGPTSVLGGFQLVARFGSDRGGLSTTLRPG